MNPPLFNGIVILLKSHIVRDKSTLLNDLSSIVTRSLIGSQVGFTVGQWQQKTTFLVQKIQATFPNQLLIVRSSASEEDTKTASQAGRFKSVSHVDSQIESAIVSAVEEVLASYKGLNEPAREKVFVQKYLTDVAVAGVILTRSLDTAAPYYQISYDEGADATASVTAGISCSIQQSVIYKHYKKTSLVLPEKWQTVIRAVQEIENLLACDDLDIEFAVDTQGQCHIFQVRHIARHDNQVKVSDQGFQNQLKRLMGNYEQSLFANQKVLGSRAIYGVMADWNPAEIIGIKPKPLALSLYKDLILNEIWAKQRKAYGYKNVVGQPLVKVFGGIPYIDLRLSLNSFIPDMVSTEATNRIVNAYLIYLELHPEYHDKVEFEVAITCLTPAFESIVAERLEPFGVLQSDIKELKMGLLMITQQATSRLRRDTEKISELMADREQILEKERCPLKQGVLLFSSVKKDAALAFAHAARAGFVAMAWLNDMVKMNLMSLVEKEIFLNNIHSMPAMMVGKEASSEKLSASQILSCCGHLRPGTYDITAPAYWENPEKYLVELVQPIKVPKKQFKLSQQARKKIQGWLDDTFASQIQVTELFGFFQQAIEARESVKFEFSKNLSMALDCWVRYGKSKGISREQLSFLSWKDIIDMSIDCDPVSIALNRIESRSSEFEFTKRLELPHLIFSQQDFVYFEVADCLPNYITSRTVTANVLVLKDYVTKNGASLKNKIVLIESADPGYDWIFTAGISGFITQYGGANSHMSIRAAELSIPAIIGVGVKAYNYLIKQKTILINCATQQIIPVLS